jgi:hypothetical protein
MTDPPSAIRREVLHLIDLQIATLRQQSSLDSFELQDFRARSERLRRLYEELDRIGRARSRAESQSRHSLLALPFVTEPAFPHALIVLN